MFNVEGTEYVNRWWHRSSGGLHPLPAVEIAPALPVCAGPSAAAAQEKVGTHFTKGCGRQAGVALTCPASWGGGSAGEAGATQPKGGVSHLIWNMLKYFLIYCIYFFDSWCLTFSRHWPPAGRQAASDEDKNGPRAFRRTNNWSLIFYKIK